MADKMEFDDYSGMTDPSKVKDAAQKGYNATKLGTETAKQAYDAMKAQKAAKAAKSSGVAGKAAVGKSGAVGKAKAAKKAGTAGKTGGLLSGSLTNLSAAGMMQMALIIILVLAMLCVFVSLSPSLFSATSDGITKAVGNVRSAIGSYYSDAIDRGIKKNEDVYTYLNDKVTGSSDLSRAVSDASHVMTYDIDGNERAFSCDVSHADYRFLAGDTTAFIQSDYCRINFDFTPSLEEQTEIIYAYGQAVNGALSAYTESAREEGKGTSDMNSELSVNGETADDFDWSQLTNEEYVADYAAENGNEYNSATSTDFADAIKDYVATHTVFFMNHDPSTWVLDDVKTETKTITKKACKLTALTNGTSNASKGAVASRTGEAFDCGGTAPEGYAIVEDPAKTKEINYLFTTLNYTAPVYFDMAGYKSDEINNVLTAMHDELGMDPDTASEMFYAQVDNYYRNYISMFGLEDVESKVLQAQYSGTTNEYDSGNQTSAAQIAGLSYMGVAAETLNGADNWIGSVIDDSDFDYSNYVYTSSTDFWNYELLHRYDTIVWGHVQALANAGKIKLSYPAEVRQCTNFATAWLYDHCGKQLPHNNGKDMAAGLVAAFPDDFGFGNAPAPGGIISVLPNHVLCCDAVIDSDGDGVADYYVISDGSVHAGSNDPIKGVRIQAKWSVADYMATYGSKHPVYANPKSH